jgi:FK506-binding nuclear protein
MVIPQADVRISNASLGVQLSDQNGRTVVKVTYSKVDDTESDEEEQEKEEDDDDSTATFVLCALTAGKVRCLTSHSFIIIKLVSNRRLKTSQ